jgi:nucleotide-binding universal stress UspA family protein
MGQLEASKVQEAPRHRIVVGVGRGGETSENAVREALALATQNDRGEVHVVTALTDERTKDLDALRQLLRDEEDWLVEYVRWVADRSVFRPARLDLVFHVRVGKPAEVLTQVAFDVHASLIVVGAAPRGRVAQVLAGGVAEQLFTEARYPLLVARPVDDADLVATQRPEPRRPGEPLSSTRETLLESSDRVDFTLPHPHVSGLL